MHGYSSNKIIAFLFILIFFISSNLSSQSQDIKPRIPEIGKPMEDIELTGIVNFPLKKTKISSFRGKWLILDAWNRSCGSCVASFPKYSKMQEEMGNKLQVMMVGLDGSIWKLSAGQLTKMYSVYQKKENLKMPCAFDSTLMDRFDIAGAPYVLVIDDKGVVRAETESVTVDDMKSFIAGNEPILGSYRKNIIPHTREKPLMVDNNGVKDGDFLFRSFLSKFNRNSHDHDRSRFSDAVKQGNGRFEVMEVALDDLYSLAYWGKICGGGYNWRERDTLMHATHFIRPILELKDSSLFQYSFNGEGKNLFIYSLSMPPENCTESSLQSAMQRDLKTYFGYEVSIETRKCFCYKIIALPGTKEKIKTKGGKPWREIPSDQSCWKFTNQPFEEIIKYFRSMIYLQMEEGGHEYFPFIQDETGITGNVDLNLDCISSSMDDVKKALLKNGLQLVPSEKEMQVLVIRDPK